MENLTVNEHVQWLCSISRGYPMLRKTIGSLFKVLALCDDVLPVQAEHESLCLGHAPCHFEVCNRQPGQNYKRGQHPRAVSRRNWVPGTGVKDMEVS